MPWLIKVWTSVSCCVLLRLASKSMNDAATVGDGALHARSVLGRPTRLLEVVPRDADDARVRRRRWPARSLALGAVVSVPPPVDALGAVLAAGEHAASAMAATAVSAATRR